MAVIGRVQGGEPSHQVMEQAAEWYALLRSGDATSGDRASWQVWLDSHGEHRQAWRYVEAVSQGFEPLRMTPDPRQTSDNLWAANVRVLQRRRLLAGMVALAGTGLLGLASWRYTPLPGMVGARLADHRTGTGEQSLLRLSDGTQVWLNTATALNEDYRSDLRRLELVTGEILVDTAADPSRPLVVDTPQGRLRALGTRFTVWRSEDHETLLAVYQGAVAVTTAEGATTVVPAGQQLSFTAAALGPVGPADPAREAWSQGMLVAHDLPLTELVRQLRRYRHGHVGLAPAVADLRVFGSFPLRDTDETLDMLAEVLPVRIRRTLPWWVSIEPAA